MTPGNVRMQAYRVVLAQLAIAAVVGALFWLFDNKQAGVSAWIGGAINVIATYYQVRIAFMRRAEGNAQRIARAFYWAEAVKLLLVAALFTLVLHWLELDLLPLIVGFIATTTSYFLALLAPLPSGK